MQWGFKQGKSSAMCYLVFFFFFKHSSTLAWKIPWTEKPGRLQSMGSLRVGRNCATSLSLFTFMHWRRKWQPIPVFMLGKSYGQRSLVDYSPWGCKELDMTERALMHNVDEIKATVVLLLLLLSRFSRVRLCATPETTAHQAPPSLGFSRQEQWRRLSFNPWVGKIP